MATGISPSVQSVTRPVAIVQNDQTDNGGAYMYYIPKFIAHSNCVLCNVFFRRVGSFRLVAFLFCFVSGYTHFGERIIKIDCFACINSHACAYMFTPHCARTPDALVYNGRSPLRPLQWLAAAHQHLRHHHHHHHYHRRRCRRRRRRSRLALTFRPLSTTRRAADNKIFNWVSAVIYFIAFPPLFCSHSRCCGAHFAEFRSCTFNDGHIKVFFCGCTTQKCCFLYYVLLFCVYFNDAIARRSSKFVQHNCDVGPRPRRQCLNVLVY